VDREKLKREGRRVGMAWAILLALVGLSYAFGYGLTAGGLIFFGGLFVLSLTLAWLRNRTLDTKPLPPGDWITVDEAAKMTEAPPDFFLQLVARVRSPTRASGEAGSRGTSPTTCGSDARTSSE
jgi:hypothetical protein